jgi:hypothetical protein
LHLSEVRIMNAKQTLLAVLALPLFTGGASAQPWSTNTLPPGLLAWWSAEGSGADTTANHNDGTLSGGVSFVAGHDGTGFAFDGVSGVVEVPDSPTLRVTNSLSIEFWAKRQRTAVDLVLEKGGDWNPSQSGEANYGVGLHSINNRMFYFFFRGGWRGTSGVADLDWHHYAVTATNGAANPVLYVDGVPRAVEFSAGAAALNLYPGLRPLHLGAQLSPGWNYYGKHALDDVRIYSRELAAAEVSYLYQGPQPRLQIQFTPPSLVTLSWASILGVTYRLQSVTSLPAAAWPDEASPFAGTGGMLTTNIPIVATPAKSFRLEVGN